MLIQTAVLSISYDEQVNCYVICVRTPDGVAEWPIGNIIPMGELYTKYLPNSDTKPKSISKKKQKRASMRQEVEVMEALGGKRNVGSGSVIGLKGDGKVRNKYRVETKYTRAGSYKLSKKELSKIRGECEGTEIPLFIIDFVDPQTGGSPDRWVILQFEDFQKMDYKPPVRK